MAAVKAPTSLFNGGDCVDEVAEDGTGDLQSKSRTMTAGLIASSAVSRSAMNVPHPRVPYGRSSRQYSSSPIKTTAVSRTYGDPGSACWRRRNIRYLASIQTSQ